MTLHLRGLALVWVTAGSLCLGWGRAQEATSRTESLNQTYAVINGVPEYRVGPGDQLKIRVWTGMELKELELLTVQADGEIFFSFFINQPVSVSGLTPTQIAEKLAESLKSYVLQPVVRVEVTDYKSRRAYLVGEVGERKSFPLMGKTQLLAFLIDHGGVSDKGDISKVIVHRRDGTPLKVDLGKAILTGDRTEDVVLDDGDLIYIPSFQVTKAKIYVFGEVNSPGIYTVDENTSVLEAVSMAGSFSREAKISGVLLIRGSASDPEVTPINMGEVIKKGKFERNLGLRNRDVLFVPRRSLSTIREAVNFATPILFLIDFLSRQVGP